jgi:MFS family permease
MRTTHIRNRNITLFYALTIAKNAIFVEGNWFFFWLRMMTHQQIGWVDATAFTFGLMMEIPTGAISDMVGKRKTLLMAMLLCAVGYAIMGSNQNTAGLVVGFLISLVGGAFYSGADEALAYETLKAQNNEKGFERVISNANMLAIFSLIIASLVGGLLYTIDVRLPYYAWAAASLVGFFCAWFVTEPDVEHETFSTQAYVQQMMGGFRQLSQPALRPFMPLILGLVGMTFLFTDGLIQPAVAEHMGFDATGQSLTFAIIAGLSASVTFFVPWLRKRFSAWTFLMMLTLFMAVGFWGAGYVAGLSGFGMLILIRLTGTVAMPWVSIVVNQHVPSRDRATTLSTVSLITKIPYALTAVLAGHLAEMGKIGLFTGGIGVFLIGLMVASTVLAMRPMVSPRLESTVEKAGAVL